MLWLLLFGFQPFHLKIIQPESSHKSQHVPLFLRILQSFHPYRSLHHRYGHRMLGYQVVSCVPPFFATSRKSNVPLFKFLTKISAVPILVANGMAYTSQSRMSADTSGSCGCAVRGSLKKSTRSIALSAIMAPIC
ncbi:cell wall surface anchor family protein [Bacillus stratosphericus LAMA 585]|nr:cell wall surface anchor family protein [Bacillus stratosphericus LAMA 585]